MTVRHGELTQMPNSCPLCTSDRTQVIELVHSDDVSRLWRHRLRIEITPFSSDTIEARLCSACHLRYFSPPQIGDERLYEQLQRFPWYYKSDKPEFLVASRHIGADDTVLEIGAGVGAFACHAQCKQYIGLEQNEQAVRLARARGIDVRLESLDQHIGSGLCQYDWVCLFQVLEHVPRPREFLNSCLQAVRPGGHLVISLPCEDSFLALETNAILNLPPHHATRWEVATARALQDIFRIRLESLEVEPLGDDHIASVAPALVQAFLRRVLRRDHRLLDSHFAGIPVRALVWLLSRPVAAILAGKRVRPSGHSMTAIFTKAQ